MRSMPGEDVTDMAGLLWYRADLLSFGICQKLPQRKGKRRKIRMQLPADLPAGSSSRESVFGGESGCLPVVESLLKILQVHFEDSRA